MFHLLAVVLMTQLFFRQLGPDQLCHHHQRRQAEQNKLSVPGAGVGEQVARIGHSEHYLAHQLPCLHRQRVPGIVSVTFGVKEQAVIGIGLQLRYPVGGEAAACLLYTSRCV